MSRQELVIGYTKLHGLNYAEKIVDSILEKVDKNKNDSLEYSEWVLATVNKQDILSLENLKKAFDVFFFPLNLILFIRDIYICFIES